MKKITVYLAGPMRGKPYFNFLQFDAYKASLEIKGIRVISPADIDRRHGFDPLKSMTDNIPTPEDCITRDVKAITKSKAVVLMPGWKKSRGSMAEVATALFLDKPCYELKNLNYYERQIRPTARDVRRRRNK